jgi:hypothetical protein
MIIQNSSSELTNVRVLRFTVVHAHYGTLRNIAKILPYWVTMVDGDEEWGKEIRTTHTTGR